MSSGLAFGVVTLFPALVEALAVGGVTARALESGLVNLRCFNPRDFTRDRHRRVDDRPYGGGPGMVMSAEPLCLATRAAREALTGGAGRVHTVYLTPQGRPIDQATVQGLARREALVLVCGRYEGVDERFVESEVDEELSLGDFVLSGGEVAAMAVIDAVTRLLPGALGHEDSAAEDSFSDGLLDCPHYTRPEVYEGRQVPGVLLSGDHEAIRRWRADQALARTEARRPDLVRSARGARAPEQREQIPQPRDRRGGETGEQPRDDRGENGSDEP